MRRSIPISKASARVAGDYVEGQLAERMDRPKLVGDIVTHWHKYGERRKTVAFAVNVAHSIHIRDEFVRVRRAREHIDGSTPKPERDATLARLASGEIEVVTQLHGADRRLGHARGRLLHPGAADQEDGPLSADDRPRAAPRRRQARRDRARSFAALFFATASSRIPSSGRSIPIAAPPVPTHQQRANEARLAPARMHAMRRRPRRRRAVLRIADSCRSAPPRAGAIRRR